MSAWVAYVGPFRFPWGQPGSRRVYGIAKSLVRAGHRVVVASGEAEPDEIQLLERENGGELFHKGLRELHRSDAWRITKAFNLLIAQGSKAVRWLDSCSERPSHVIAYGAYASFMARLLPWCRRAGVALIADVVEWYEPSHQPGGFLGPFNASSNVALRLQYPRCDGIVAISSFLEAYYRPRVASVVRVPPTLDVINTRARDADAGGRVGALKLIYAGTPAKKDQLRNIVRGLRIVDPHAKRVELNILGVAPHDAVSLLDAGDALPPCVNLLGRVAQPEVYAAYLRADFSVLLREPLRYAEAGFPTKVPESLAAGVPIICNVTSDIAEYVSDGEEGLFCRDHTAEAFAEAVERALRLSSLQRREMSARARTAAERFFDYRNYTDELAAFIEVTRQRGRAAVDR